jgi:hypothetical protein
MIRSVQLLKMWSGDTLQQINISLTSQNIRLLNKGIHVSKESTTAPQTDPHVNYLFMLQYCPYTSRIQPLSLNFCIRPIFLPQPEQSASSSDDSKNSYNLWNSSWCNFLSSSATLFLLASCPVPIFDILSNEKRSYRISR